uniref:CS domain-containing protein n=1 Tax=Clastoptera arizonana TaxID=38151 RepID=A0A1B6EC06_9HEMI
MSISHFDEKSGIIPCTTPWGSWWQTVHEIHIEINLPKNTRSKDVKIDIQTNYIACFIHQKVVIKGKLFGSVHCDDSVWTIEDGCLLNIVLSKAQYEKKEDIWEALLQDGSYQPDLLTLHEMRKKIDLEKFQLENPGMDFSRAKLSKNYDKLPGETLKQQLADKDNL